jgi:uncharacterized membrane protein YoaK (UPF0700 family)
MIRILWRLVFFILPFIVFWFYVRFAEGYRRRYGQGFYASHWYWVAFIGLLMFAASLVALWAWGDRSVSGNYIPPHVVNGKVVPGEFKP